MTDHTISKYVKNQRLHFRCTCGVAAIYPSDMRGLMRLTTAATAHKRKTDYEMRNK